MMKTCEKSVISVDTRKHLKLEVQFTAEIEIKRDTLVKDALYRLYSLIRDYSQRRRIEVTNQPNHSACNR